MKLTLGRRRGLSSIAGHWAVLAVIVAGVAAPATVQAASASSLPASFVTYPLSYAGVANDLRLGPDGGWWVPNQFGTTIDRMTTTGLDSSFQWGSFLIFPRITSGADGNLWMIDPIAGGIDKISPTGTLLATYATSAANLGDVILGPNGNVWFSDFETGQVGQITPAGSITIYQWPDGVGTEFITDGPDGNVWVADQIHGEVGRITPGGVISVFPIPSLDRQPAPTGIATGPDGNVWYADPGAHAIGRVTPSGVITEFVAPNGIQPFGIAPGPDGNLWFTDYFDGHVGRITTGGQIGLFDASSVGQFPKNITSGPDGRMWLTLVGLGASPASVAAFQPFAPAASPPDIRSVSPPYTLPAGGGKVVITGYDIGSATQVLFGSTPATSFSSLGPGQLVATVPQHAIGAVDVTVVTPDGTTAASTGSHFYYQATNCGTTISMSTRLTADIGPCYTAGLTVAADHVTLDLNGHGVVGFQTPRDGTVVGINLPQRSGVTVANGMVSGFDVGVHIGGGSGNTVAHMNIHDNIGPDDPNAAFGDGIMIEHASSNNRIEHNVINHNGVFDGIGIFDSGSDRNTIAYNTVENTVGPADMGPAGEGIIVNGAGGSGTPTAAITSTVVEHNVVSNNASSGIANINEIGGTIEYNTVTGSGATNAFGNGIGVQIGYNWSLGPTDMVIEHNQVSGNGVDGIRLGGAFGFFSGAAEGNTVAYNIVTGNATNPSVDAYEGSPQGYDLDDIDPTCGTNIWSKNTWGSAGFTPVCTSTGGSGPVPAANSQAAAPRASTAKTPLPNAQAWESLLERGRT